MKTWLWSSNRRQMFGMTDALGSCTCCFIKSIFPNEWCFQVSRQSTRSPHDSDDSWKKKRGQKPWRLLLSPSRAPGGWQGDSWRIISKVCGSKENDSVPKSTLKTIMAFCTCAQIHLSLLIMSCTISGACAFFTGEVTRTGRLVDWEAGARRWPVMQGLPWTPPLGTWASGNQTKPNTA